MPLRRVSFQPPPASAYTPVGSMCHQIQLLTPGARNTGGTSQAPSPFATIWAAIRALAGQELYKAQQIVQEVTHLVTILYLPGVTEAMLVSFEARLFQIKAIEDPDERHIELRILCVERNQSA